MIVKLNTAKKIIAVAISTKGYCQEILDLQPRHLLLRIKKETIGISSCQCSFLLQLKQPERPFTPLPVFNLKITTFKKLPIMTPSIRKKNDKITIIDI